MKYVWHDDDPGDDHDVDEETGLTYTRTVTIKRGENDDLAGEAIVSYNDPTSGIGTVYNTGIIKFWVNQK